MNISTIALIAILSTSASHVQDKDIRVLICKSPKKETLVFVNTPSSGRSLLANASPSVRGEFFEMPNSGGMFHYVFEGRLKFMREDALVSLLVGVINHRSGSMKLEKYDSKDKIVGVISGHCEGF